MAQKFTYARIKANEKKDENNQDHSSYLNARSAARSFIKKRANLDDISELRSLLDSRENNLKNDDK